MQEAEHATVTSPVKRNLTGEGTQQSRRVDTIKHNTKEEKIYLCGVKDVFSRRFVGYPIADRRKAKILVAALNNAVSWRGEATGCGAAMESLFTQMRNHVLDR